MSTAGLEGGGLKGGGLRCGPSAGPALPPAASQHGRGAAPAEVAPSRPPPARLSLCPGPWVAARCLHPPPGPASAPLSQAGVAPPAAWGLPAVPGPPRGPVGSLRVVPLLGVLPSLSGGLWGLRSPWGLAWVDGLMSRPLLRNGRVTSREKRAARSQPPVREVCRVLPALPRLSQALSSC